MRTIRRTVLAAVLAAVAIPVAIAFAQTSAAPTVASAAATGVGDSSATFNGSVNPNAAATQYAFQYGPTTSYGEETTLTSAGAGSGVATVAASATALQPGTTYHFRIIAISAGGTSPGADESFTTSGTTPAHSTPPSASTGGSSGVGQAGATLAGTINPQGQSTDYYFEYGPTGNYGFMTTPQNASGGTSAIAVSAGVTGLGAGTTYHYRLVSTSAGGVTLGNDAAFTTSTPPLVSTAGATGVTNDSAVFSGTVNPEGKDATYYFQYGTTTSYGLQTAPSSAGAGTSLVAVNAEVTGLTPNTAYHYRLVSTSAGGTTYGNDQSVATPGSTTPASTVRLMGRMGFVSPGSVIGVEVGCFGSSPCAGTFQVTANGKLIGSGKYNQKGNTGGFQNIKLNATGQNDLKANHPNHLLATIVTITTTGGQKIEGHMSMARWSWKDL